MDANSCIIIYLSIYIILLSCYVLNRRNEIINSTSVLLAYYAFAGICSLLFYNLSHGILRDYSFISLPPFIYLIILVLFSFYPIYKYDKYSPSLIISSNQYKIIDTISYFLAFCSILPFFETLVHLPSTLANQGAIADVYDTRLAGNGTGEYLSWFGRKFYYIIMLCSLLLPICLFAQLLKRKINLKLIFCLILCIIVDALHNMIGGGRSGLVQNLLYLIMVFSLFRNQLPLEYRKKSSFYGIIVIAISLSALMVVSLSRFLSDDNNTESYGNVFGWMSLYAGEGPLNFNNTLWHINKTTERTITFPLIDGIVNGSFLTVTETWEIGDKLGVAGNIFYTWIGSFYKDFGCTTTFFIISFLSCLFSLCVRKRHFIGIVPFTLLCIWSKIVIVGPVFYAYGTIESQFEILICVLFCFLLKINESIYINNHPCI